MSIFAARLRRYTLLLGLVIMAASFAVRVINLNYNSPFNDEAIYIVIGKLGLFEGDWTFYNASSWMAGLPFLYPPFSALAYTAGGIIGSRFLNVFFGVVTVGVIFAITYLLSTQEEKYKLYAASISSALVGGTAVALYVSRLATYDALSFFLLFLSLFLLLLAQKSKNPAKTYFFAFLALLAAFGTKIIVGIFIPLMVIPSYLVTRGNRKLFLFWRAYFLTPLAISLLIYLAFNFGNLISYYRFQNLPRVSAGEVLGVFRENLGAVSFFYLFGSLGMMAKKRWKTWALLSLMAFWILLFHLVVGHPLSLDKHTFLSVTFLSIASGLGISHFISENSPARTGSQVTRDVIIILALFWIYSYQEAQKYNTLWRNTDAPHAFLASEVKSSDRILSEPGASTILALYEKTSPTNVTSFDWLEYKKLSGPSAFRQATRDGYFNYMLLESQELPKLENIKHIHDVVTQSTEGNYSVIYDQDGFSILKRNF